jgi:hypothetical protein
MALTDSVCTGNLTHRHESRETNARDPFGGWPLMVSVARSGCAPFVSLMEAATLEKTVVMIPSASSIRT